MTKRYVVHNLRCAGCAARIEDAIAGLPGVKSAAINLDSARLRVEGEQPELAAMIRLADAIEPGTLFSELDENEPLPESSEPQPSLLRSEYKLWIAAALFAVGMIFEERLDALLNPFVAKAVFFGIPYLLCGLSVLKKGLQSLLKFDFFNEYTLMGGATIAAAAIGQLPEAVASCCSTPSAKPCRIARRATRGAPSGRCWRHGPQWRIWSRKKTAGRW